MKQRGFPKSVRLLRTTDYRRVYAEGRRRNLEWLVAFSLATGRSGSRVGLTVPTSVGGAVTRNRIKRRLREAVRRNLGEIGPGWDIVLHPRAAAAALEFETIQQTVREFFRSCAASARRAGRSDTGETHDRKAQAT